MSPTLFLVFVLVIVAMTALGIRAEIQEYHRQERFADAIGDVFGELIRCRKDTTGRIEELRSLLAAAEDAGVETRGTYNCGICGKDTPHTHADTPMDAP